MAYPNQVFSFFAFLGFLLCAIPLPWHLEAWNTGTCLYMIWTGLACLNQFINSVVWRENAINWAPVWCDISAKFIIGTSVAIPAASLCINRRLYHIASVKTVTISKADKRRAVYVDLAIGMGLPILEMILHYIPQGHRFNILEDIGCWPHTYNTWVAYVVVYVPPILIGLISAAYAVRSIIAFMAFSKSSNQFSEVLSGHSNLNSSRYFRLMCLAGIEVLCTVPVGCYVVYRYSQGSAIRPWISWERVHWRFSRVDNIPALTWRSNVAAAAGLEFGRWLCVICAIIFFAFFGFADEARKHYRSAVQSITKRVGISTGSFAGTSSGGFFSSDGGVKSKNGSTGKIRPSLPVFVHKEMLRRQNSLDSISQMSININDVGGFLGEKKKNEDDDATEKASEFAPTLSYGGITLNDVGGTLPEYTESPISPTSAAAATTSSSSSPSPAITRENSHCNIEISSLRRDSVIPPPEKAHTPDVV